MIGYKWCQAHRRTRVGLIQSEVSSKFLFLIFKLVIWHQKWWIKLLELTLCGMERLKSFYLNKALF